MEKYELTEVLGKAITDMVLSMTRSNAIPNSVIRRICQIKKLIDRVDAPVNPCVIAGILIDCGFDPNSNTYYEGEQAQPEPVESVELTKLGPSNKTETPAPPVEDEYVGLIPVGTKVSFMRGKGFETGEIKSAKTAQGVIFYDVEIEGEEEPVEVHEDDVELM
jgi:hypothetical protein